MPRSTRYSTFRSPLAKVFKFQHPAQTESEFVKFADRVWAASISRLLIQYGERKLSEHTTFIPRDSVTVELTALFLWKYRRITHYFLDAGVAEFCAGAVKSLSEDFCKPIPECASDRPDGCMLPWTAFKRDGESMCGGFAVHFPLSERDRSVFVIPECGIIIDRGLFSSSYLYGATDGDWISLMCHTHLMDDRPATAWIEKLVMGLSLYLDAFPDAVVSARDHGIEHIKHIKGDAVAVVANDAVSDDVRHCKSPHWRRGHFRVLTADRFVHKKGMTVYVRGSFVLGTALDVLDDAPPSRDGGD